MEIVDQSSSFVSKVLNFIENNKVLNTVVSMLLILYVIFAAPKLPRSVVKVFDHSLFKLGYMFLIAYIAKKDDKYVMFYAKQSLVLFFAWLIVWVASMILGFIPVIGWLIIAIAEIGLLILWIVGMVYAFSGEMKQIPLVGPFADKFSF